MSSHGLLFCCPRGPALHCNQDVSRTDALKPIQDILNRIRWDPEYGDARFEIGYYDRVADKIIVAPFSELWFSKTDHYTFQLIDEDGVDHCVPFHRVRDVYRNGERIWHRDAKHR